MKNIILLMLLNFFLFSMVYSQKEGGIAFRIDDNQKIDRYLEYADVFNKYNQKFTFAINLDRVENTEYLTGLKKLQTDGHEMMDHTPNHRTNYFYTQFDPQSYVGVPGVVKVSGTKICVEHEEVDLSNFDKEGYVDIINEKVFSPDGDFENFRAAECYLYFPALSQLVYVEDIQDKNNLFIRDIWRDSIDLGVHQSLEYYTFTYNNVHLSKNGFKVLASESVKLAEVHGLERPKSWIQPGGYFPHVTRNEAKEACSEIGFVSAGVFQNPALKVFNEYDPDDDAQFGMDWGNFMVYSWTLNDLKKKISDETAKHKVLIGSSHFQNLLGGWDGYLARLDSLLDWCVKNDIPIKTYEEWGDELYNTDQDPYVNIIPSFNRDINEDGLPDGIEVRESGEFHQSENSTERSYFSARGNGEILKIRGLGGIEKGDLDFDIWLKGSPGNIVEVSFGWSTNKVAFPAESTEWKKYSLRESINGKTSLAMPDNYSVMDIVVACSEFSSGEVQIGGMELTKLQPLKLNSFNEGGIYLTGDTTSITWFKKETGGVNIYLSEDDGLNWKEIAAQISDEEFDWIIPAVNSDSCLLKVTDASDEEIFDISDQNFSIFKDQEMEIIVKGNTEWIDEDFVGSASGLLDGSLSNVNFGVIDSYKWVMNGTEIGNSVKLNADLPIGTNKIELICRTDIGIEKSDSIEISVFSAKVELNEKISTSFSRLTNGNLIAGTDQGRVVEFDSTGTLQKDEKLFEVGASTYCVDFENGDYFSSLNNTICVFNSANQLMDEIKAETDWFIEPAILNSETLLSVTRNGKLIAFKRENDEEEWSVKLSDSCLTSPVISSSTDIFTGSKDGTMYKISSDGKYITSFYVGEAIVTPQAVANEAVIVGTTAGSLLKLDSELNKLWEFDAGSELMSSPVIDEAGNIYAGLQSGEIISVSSDGKLNWKYNAGSPVTGFPSLGINGLLYIGLEDGNMVALDRSGKLIWSLKTGDTIISSPIILDNGRLILNNIAGQIFVLQDNNYSPNEVQPGKPLTWQTYKGNFYRAGNLKYVPSSVDDEQIPGEFYLSQNYPNPFNPSTIIEFALPERANVILEVYNLLGERVKTLLKEELNAGVHKINFSAAGLSSGVYLYRISSEKFNQTRKFVLMK